MRVGRPEVTCLLLLTDRKLQEYISYTKKLSRTTNVTAFPEVWILLHLNIPLYTYSMIVIVYMNIMECVYVAITFS